MNDYSDFIPAPELFDDNRDGILDSDELAAQFRKKSKNRNVWLKSRTEVSLCAF